MEGTVLSLFPPLIAICLCIVLRDAIPSLLIGVFSGALILYQFNPITALLRSFDTIIVSSFTDRDHAINLFFVVLIGGMVEIMNRSETTRAWISFFASRLRSRNNGAVSIWFAGILMFIDDYANSLIIGNGFRKFADGLRISREKLAFLVDTTSAPITSLALVSTWIGFEVSVIGDAIEDFGVTDQYSGYGLFFASIPYRFYAVMMLLFCLMVAFTGRDFGPMRKKEAEAASNGDDLANGTDASKHKRPKTLSLLVFLPVFVLTLMTLYFLVVSGLSNGAETDPNSIWLTFVNLFTEASAFESILWATLIASIFSFAIHLGVLREAYGNVMENWMAGCQGMFTICIILLLAWSIGSVCSDLETGAYIASLLGEDFDPHFLPLLTFIFAAGTSFATGTSYGTMSILFPIALPLAFQFGSDNPEIIYGTTGSVLAGAIFGDHCSPISDTTILSSGASGCSVTAHVNTQLPYALLVAAASCVCLAVSPFETMHPWVLNAAGLVFLLAMLYAIGRRPPTPTQTAPPPEHAGQSG